MAKGESLSNHDAFGICSGLHHSAELPVSSCAGLRFLERVHRISGFCLVRLIRHRPEMEEVQVERMNKLYAFFFLVVLYISMPSYAAGEDSKNKYAMLETLTSEQLSDRCEKLQSDDEQGRYVATVIGAPITEGRESVGLFSVEEGRYMTAFRTSVTLAQNEKHKTTVHSFKVNEDTFNSIYIPIINTIARDSGSYGVCAYISGAHNFIGIFDTFAKIEH